MASTVESPAPPPAERRRVPMPLLVLEGMRPRQWTKNAFVLAAIVFAGEALQFDPELDIWRMVLAFCLASGAAYLVNDVRDAEVDRHNPRTSRRPIARGDLAPGTALVAAALAALAAIAIAGSIRWEAAAVVAGFLVLQLAYSSLLKHLLLIDVMAIAAGFVLRAFGGAVAIDVQISEWLLACTALLALLLALGKRRAEVVALGGSSDPRRPVLDGYSVALLDELIAVVTPATVVLYTVYAVLGAQSNAMLLTVPFVLYGVFRILVVIHHGDGRTEEPDLVIWRDRPLLACVVLWGITALIVAAVA